MAVKEDLEMCPAELVYGTSLKLPGEFFRNLNRDYLPHMEFLHRLQAFMRHLRPVAGTKHTQQKPFVAPDLKTVTHVFIRVDSCRRPLQQPYQGPFKVIKRHDKYFKIQIGSEEKNVSIDRLKPAFFEQEDPADNVPQVRTRSGRISRPVVRFTS